MPVTLTQTIEAGRLRPSSKMRAMSLAAILATLLSATQAESKDNPSVIWTAAKIQNGACSITGEYKNLKITLYESGEYYNIKMNIKGVKLDKGKEYIWKIIFPTIYENRISGKAIDYTSMYFANVFPTVIGNFMISNKFSLYIDGHIYGEFNLKEASKSFKSLMDCKYIQRKRASYLTPSNPQPDNNRIKNINKIEVYFPSILDGVWETDIRYCGNDGDRTEGEALHILSRDPEYGYQPTIAVDMFEAGESSFCKVESTQVEGLSLRLTTDCKPEGGKVHLAGSASLSLGMTGNAISWQSPDLEAPDFYFRCPEAQTLAKEPAKVADASAEPECEFNSRLYRSLSYQGSDKDNYQELQFKDGSADGTVDLTEYSQGKAIWVAHGQFTCSNGVSICYLKFPLTLGDPMQLPYETVDSTTNSPEMVVIPALVQEVYLRGRDATAYDKPYGGLVVDFLNGFKLKEDELTLPVNAYAYAGCRR